MWRESWPSNHVNEPERRSQLHKSSYDESVSPRVCESSPHFTVGPLQYPLSKFGQLVSKLCSNDNESNRLGFISGFEGSCIPKLEGGRGVDFDQPMKVVVLRVWL